MRELAAQLLAASARAPDTVLVNENFRAALTRLTFRICGRRLRENLAGLSGQECVRGDAEQGEGLTLKVGELRRK